MALQGAGKPLLEANIIKFPELKLHSEQEGRSYTQQILNDQILTAADKTWEKGDYNEFIKIISRTNLNRIPSSYQLKYKIAQKRVQHLAKPPSQ
ncbi:hypothetical protein IM793_16825 [Pedobacter sp. MR2016-19]|uniref:hypothetical protein n=1 Tax=Pedobacter sp. MR2016-19 TaxID=2780089 RepID=UPI0018756F2D|nr:hypothetical protein [Pedobacter sp. MR2016-19]MBE5320835.1 hypothetical protein [Pedobacter sp. MR2016-19]